MNDIPSIPTEVARVFETWPEGPRARLMEIRSLILNVALDAEIGTLTETLKWGEPAYLPARPRVGTTIRLGWSAALGPDCALYVPCQSNLVDRYRQTCPTEFAYDGDRAVRIPVAAPLAAAPLRRMITMALRYHRDKKHT